MLLFQSTRPQCRWKGMGFLLVGFLMCNVPQHVSAEWYVAGYGGWSMPDKLKNIHMDNFGQSQGIIFFPGASTSPPLGTLAQSFKSSDLGLKNSFMYGGKAGYFFKDEGLSWLGLELEAFTSQPTIRSQTVDTRHDVTYLPSNPMAPPCQFGVNCLTQQANTGTLKIPETSLRLIALAFNVVARYPGETFQPYVGVGVGAFYFMAHGRGSDNFLYSTRRYDNTAVPYKVSTTAQIDGRQVVPGLNAMAGFKILLTEELGIFFEGKYNRATITNFDPTFGLTGEYSSFNAVAGLAYHF